MLDEIEDWGEESEGFDKSQIFWLNGLAGAGGFAIAQTIADSSTQGPLERLVHLLEVR